MTKEEYAEELDNKLRQVYGIIGRHGGSHDLIFIMKEKYELEKEVIPNDQT